MSDCGWFCIFVKNYKAKLLENLNFETQNRKNIQFQSRLLADKQEFIKRGDIVSINHRIAAFMEAYFDVIFALNELSHPGEKRLMQLCAETCRILPDRFEENLKILYNDMYSDFESISGDIENIIAELEKVAL